MSPRISVSLLAILPVIGCNESNSRAPAPEAAPAAPRAAPPPATSASAAPGASSPVVVEQPWPLHPSPDVETDWCIDVVTALDAETCYVLPEKRTNTLLIYLHGIVPPTKDSIQKTNFETVVANTAKRAGAAALIPRGEQGLAPKGHDRWWGWPTTGPSYQRLGPKLLAKIADKQAALEKLAGARFERVYVAGSSSGAYFVAAIALHGGMKVDGYGAMSGGAGARTPELAKLDPKPFYVGFGKHDSVAGGARALADVLRGAGWPVEVAAHDVGHGAKEVYVDEAFAFWRKHEK